MKKIILTTLLLFSLVGCKNNTDQTKENILSKESNLKPAIETKQTKMDAKAYDSAVKKAQEKSNELKEDYLQAEKMSKSAFTDSVLNLEDMQSKTDLGVQGVVIDSNPYIDIEENFQDGIGRTRLTFLVNQVLYGDQSLVGQTIIIYQPTGFITKRQLGLQNKFPEMSDEELNSPMLSEVNGVAPLATGTELIAYLAKDLEGDEVMYGFYSINLTMFDKNEATGEYQQVNPEITEETPENADYFTETKQLNEEVNELIED
ncbi:hypothetical protein ACWOFR_07760 [Carnobacterium gallinarum]|uniref:hypothetical protein n=1 Tax=Carnobacterium gallinarum TaxID=2749 RepID=UPI00054EFF3B|nr:hypothetical protein [Carnobacterium gallinarum]